MLGSFRAVCIRAYAYGEHGCAIAFAGLEFSERIHLLLTVCSIVLLAAFVMIAASEAHDKLKGVCNGNRDSGGASR